MTKNDPLYRAKQVLLTHCRTGGSTMVLAAVSGGLDSMCLLHLLHTWGPDRGLAVTAAHFHHGLRGDAADRDEAFVRHYCEKHNIPYLSEQGDTRALAQREGLSIEEAARKLRYAFLERAAAACDCACILTAHHADDNAETMLLNLLRGTGSRGLGGIPSERGAVCRPFLTLPRTALEAYAAEHAIAHVEDETNGEDIAARNILRHRVLPVLRELNPRAVEHMARTAAILEGETAVLEDMAAALTAEARETERRLSISCKALQDAPRAIAERAVLSLLERACGHRKDLGAAHVEAVLRLVLHNDDGEVHLPYGLRACRTGERLLLVPGSIPAQETPLTLSGETRWGDFLLTCEKKSTQGVPKPHAVLLNWEKVDGTLTVGPWRPGDGLTVGRGRRSLKRLFAEGHIPPVRRDTLPVIYVAGRPAAVPGIAVDAAFVPVSGGEVLEITARCAE